METTISKIQYYNWY